MDYSGESYLPHEQNMDSDYHIETFESKASEWFMVIITDTEVSLTNLKTLFLSDTHLRL